MKHLCVLVQTSFQFQLQLCGNPVPYDTILTTARSINFSISVVQFDFESVWGGKLDATQALKIVRINENVFVVCRQPASFADYLEQGFRTSLPSQNCPDATWGQSQIDPGARRRLLIWNISKTRWQISRKPWLVALEVLLWHHILHHLGLWSYRFCNGI